MKMSSIMKSLCLATLLTLMLMFTIGSSTRLTDKSPQTSSSGSKFGGEEVRFPNLNERNGGGGAFGFLNSNAFNTQFDGAGQSFSDMLDRLDKNYLLRRMVLSRVIASNTPDDFMVKREDDIPPGFIGVRGRRSSPNDKAPTGIFFGKQPATVSISQAVVDDPSIRERLFKSFPSSMFDSLRQSSFLVQPSTFSSTSYSNQKKDNPEIYKDGFLGVRGR